MPLVDDVANEALRLTQLMIQDIESMMGPNGASMAEMSTRDKQTISGLLTKLMRAATGMIKEHRSLQKDAKKAAEDLSYDDKRALVREFIKIMPPEHQAELRAELGW